MKIIITAILVFTIQFVTAQKKQKVKDTKIELAFPIKRSNAYISSHFGMVKTKDGIKYDNTSVTFAAPLNSNVICCTNNAKVKTILKDDENIYTVFLQKNKYTIVLSNLKNVTVKQGQILSLGNEVGKLNNDEMNHNRAILELMLFKNSKILNPENYLKQNMVETAWNK